LLLAGCPPSGGRGPKTNGGICAANPECQSGYCADGFRCAPVDDTGQTGEYCHHDNQCRSNRCGCDFGQRSPDSFCNNWRSGSSGTCLAKRDNGHDCTHDDNCASGYCPDKGGVKPLDWWPHPQSGGHCAPRNTTGKPGDYCHHNDHCASGNCNCPGAKSLGFCANWESFNFNVADTIGGRPNEQSLEVQMSRGFFMCR